MHHSQGHNLYAAYTKSLVGQEGVEPQFRRRRIFARPETIGQPLLQMLHHQRFAKDINRIKDAEGPKIIYSAHMVVMLVSDQQGMYRSVGLMHHLFAEIGAAVNQYARSTALRCGKDRVFV